MTSLIVILMLIQNKLIIMVATFPSSVLGLESYPTVVMVINPHLSIVIVIIIIFKFIQDYITYDTVFGYEQDDKILLMVLDEATKNTRQRSKCRFAECAGWCSSKTLQPVISSTKAIIVIIVSLYHSGNLILSSSKQSL